MIIGLTGPICAGKKTFAEYLKNAHGFHILNLYEYFMMMLENEKTPPKLRKIGSAGSFASEGQSSQNSTLGDEM